MRVFIAGATGVIGRRLATRLVLAGHDVVGMTRTAAKCTDLRKMGVQPVVVDAFNDEAVISAIVASRPEVVVNQLTDLPRDYKIRKLRPYFERTGRLRLEGGCILLEAARRAGARRFVAQSVAFMYKVTGEQVVTEASAEFAEDAPAPFGPAATATHAAEELVLRAPDLEALVLRYGVLYGPGTHLAPDGSFARDARRRALPVIGSGEGLTSFVHVDDAVTATVIGLERGRGVYQVVDDEPAAARDWIPAFAAAVGAPRPWHMPTWLARPMAGAYTVEQMEMGRGASNARARLDLGWQPSFESWRRGFTEGMSAAA
jgi:2-alkyl-3-oxoalkanoate reductase